MKKEQKEAMIDDITVFCIFILGAIGQILIQTDWFVGFKIAGWMIAFMFALGIYKYRKD